MAREFARTDRIADVIQRTLANVILQEIGDPRVGMVNINDVTVTRDLSVAKVYVTFVGEKDEKMCVESTKVLNNAAGYLRNFIAKELNTRIAPRLQFIYDQSVIRGQALSNLIDKAVAEDELRDDGDQNEQT